MADRRDDAVVLARASSVNGFAPQALASASTRATASRVGAAAGRRPTAGRGTASASAAPKPVVSRPAIGWPPTNRRPSAVGARGRSRPSSIATSVTTASRPRNAASGPASSSRSSRHRSAAPRGRRGRRRRRRLPGSRPRRRSTPVGERRAAALRRAASRRVVAQPPPGATRERAGDRPADQPEPEERDAHGPSIGVGAVGPEGGRLESESWTRLPRVLTLGSAALREAPSCRRLTDPGNGAAPRDVQPARPPLPLPAPIRVLLVDDHRLILGFARPRPRRRSPTSGSSASRRTVAEAGTIATRAASTSS